MYHQGYFELLSLKFALPKNGVRTFGVCINKIIKNEKGPEDPDFCFSGGSEKSRFEF